MERKDAEKYFPSIAHSYRPISGLEGKLWNWMIGKAFGKVDIRGKEHIENIPAFPRQDSSMPVYMHVQRHRSELDYILTLTTLNNHGRFALTQAGHNLFIGPFDTFIKNRGGFKVYRIPDGWHKVVYDPHWLKNWAQKKRASLELETNTPVVFTKDIYREVYLEYVKAQVEDGYDILVYPGFEQSLGRKNLGRSKTGALNEFSPIVFGAFLKAADSRQLYVLPSNVSYERIFEDVSMGKVKEIRKRHGNAIAYAYDFYSIFQKARNQKTLPRAAVSFGAPIGIDKKQLKNSLKYSHRLAKKARNEVGLQETVYPTQLVAYSALQEHINLDWLEKIKRFVHLGRKWELPSHVEINYKKLKENYNSNAAKLIKKLPLDNIIGFESDISRVFELFNGENIIDDKVGSFIVRDVPVLSQYANHILHLF